MKMIKVDDDIHAELKKSDKSINKTIRDLVFGSPRTDLEVVLDQMNMRFDALGGIDVMDIKPSVLIAKGEDMEDALKLIKSETKQDRFLRIKAEQAETEKRRKHAIERPEDEDQSGGTF